MVNGFVSKVGDIVSLSNDKLYMIMDCISYNEGSYVSAVLVGSKDDNKELEAKYFEEIITEDKKLVYREVVELETKKALLSLQQEFKD